MLIGIAAIAAIATIATIGMVVETYSMSDHGWIMGQKARVGKGCTVDHERCC